MIRILVFEKIEKGTSPLGSIRTLNTEESTLYRVKYFVRPIEISPIVARHDWNDYIGQI